MTTSPGYPHQLAWVAATTQAGPNGKRFDSYADLHMGAVPAAGIASMYDSTSADSLPAGAPAYAGYYNGSFANLTAIRARFPHAEIVTITPDGTHGAMYLDIEPGNVTVSSLVAFIRGGGLGFYASPGAAPGYSVANGISALTAAGIPRSRYRVWSAHWIGRHICGPSVCGYPQADGTQYVSTTGWDESACKSPEFFTLTPIPVPVPPKPPAPPPPPAGVPAWQTAIYSHLPTLSFGGASSEFTREAQALCNVAGPKSCTVDGYFGAETKASVVDVQMAHGLSVTGTVNADTWRVLVARSLSGVLPTISSGSTDVEFVKRVQAECVAHGTLAGGPLGSMTAVDGVFGAVTKASVEAVQRKYLPYNQIDGVVGPVTWSCLVAFRHP